MTPELTKTPCTSNRNSTVSDSPQAGLSNARMSIIMTRPTQR